MLRLLGLPPKPARVEFFGAIVVRQTEKIYWWCLVPIKRKGFWDVIFSYNVNNLQMMLESCFLSCFLRDFPFSGCFNLPPESKSLEDTTFPRWCCFKFLWDSSSLLLIKTFAVIDAILLLICPHFLNSVIKKSQTFSLIILLALHFLSFKNYIGKILFDLVHNRWHILRFYINLYHHFVVFVFSFFHQLQHKL